MQIVVARKHKMLLDVGMNDDEFVTTTIRLPRDVTEKVDAVAARQHNSRSGVIRQALDAFVLSLEAGASRQAESATAETEPALAH